MEKLGVGVNDTQSKKIGHAVKQEKPQYSNGLSPVTVNDGILKVQGIVEDEKCQQQNTPP